MKEYNSVDIANQLATMNMSVWKMVGSSVIYDRLQLDSEEYKNEKGGLSEENGRREEKKLIFCFCTHA